MNYHIKTFLSFFLPLLIFNQALFSQDKKLKKIKIIETNNVGFKIDKNKLAISADVTSEDFTKLKKLVLDDLPTLLQNKEFDVLTKLMLWVNSQWRHDGNHSAPFSMSSYDIVIDARENNTQYRCVEYGGVLSDALASLGFVSRSVSLRSVDVEYGGAGQGHVATEVWSNEYNKWIFLDPQFGVWAEHQNKPLSLYDIYSIKKVGKSSELVFNRITKQGIEPHKTYFNFLTNYLGFLAIKQKIEGEKQRTVLLMEGKNPYLVFQAHPDGNSLFTKDPNELYYKINETRIIIDFTEDEIKRSGNEANKIEINSYKSYYDNMYRWAPKPRFKISLKNDVPWFDSYVLQLNGETIKDKNGFYFVSLEDGENILLAYSNNKFGVQTNEVKVKFLYE